MLLTSPHIPNTELSECRKFISNLRKKYPDVKKATLPAPSAKRGQQLECGHQRIAYLKYCGHEF